MLAADPLVGRSVTGFSVAGNVDRADQENQSWLNGELTHLERETDLVTRDGETLQAVIRSDAVVLPSGRRYFLAQLRDVTARAAAGTRPRRQRGPVPAAGREPPGDLGDAVRPRPAADRRRRRSVGRQRVFQRPRRCADARRVPGRRAWTCSKVPIAPRLAGRATDFTYASPIGGRLFRARARPMFNPDGEVVGGLSVMEDVTADHTRATQLDQVHEFGQFGGSTFDLRSGWTYDDALLELWGIDDPSQLSGLPLHLLTPDERDADCTGWSKVLTRTRATFAVLQHDPRADRGVAAPAMHRRLGR